MSGVVGRAFGAVVLVASVLAVSALPASHLLSSDTLYDQAIAAWSMRKFTPGPVSGHDHFFATFDKFGAANSGRTGDGLAEIASRAAEQNEFALETMITPNYGGVLKIHCATAFWHRARSRPRSAA